MDSEERAHPDKPVTRKNWLDLATKHADYVKIQKFVKKQKDKFEKEKAKVQNLKHLDAVKRQKKIENAEHRILTVEVNKEAACLKTCCIHCKPTFDSAVFGTCNIHMEPNEWWRFLSRLELLCRQSTLDHFECNVIHKVAKKKLQIQSMEGL